MSVAGERTRERTSGVLWLAAFAVSIAAGCLLSPQPDPPGITDAGADDAAAADARNDGGEGGPGPDADADADADADGDGWGDVGDVADDYEPACPPPDPTVQQALEDDVQAFLTTDDSDLLDRLDGDYGGLCFASFVQAIRARPLTTLAPLPGDRRTMFVNHLTDESLVLYVYLPASAVLDGSVRVPLVLWLHGAGGSGEWDIANPDLRAFAEATGAVLAAPTSSTTCDWSADDSCAAQVHDAIRELKIEFPIDDDRVYLTGFSMGGRGSFTVGLTWPDLHAGMAPVAGSIGAIQDTTDIEVHRTYVRPHVENALPLRTRLITGLDDHPLLVLQNRAASEVFAEFGYDFAWTQLTGVGHAFPPAEWTTAMTDVVAHARDPYPRHVIYDMAWHASSYYPDLFLNTEIRANAFWLRIESRADVAAAARVEGTIEGQTVTIATGNVTRLSVYLADELLSLDLPVTILVNGASWFEGSVLRDPHLALEHARERMERSMVFAARITADVP